jgi:hypothetical protein
LDSLLSIELDALLQIGRWLKAKHYRFICPTPLTTARVNARPINAATASLAGIFGWNRPFLPDAIPESLLELMHEAGVVQRDRRMLRSTVRFSSLADEVYLHSGYPTLDSDAVFFGPDTYRFVRLVIETLRQRPHFHVSRIIDVCCGSGAGGLAVAKQLRLNSADGVLLSDINLKALRFAAVNATLASMPDVQMMQADLFAGLPPADVIIANPPYLVDPSSRIYRHGGGKLGTDLAVRIAIEGLSRLESRGCLILYTGAPILAGEDRLLAELSPKLQELSVDYSYEELDPDVFGEELEQPPYAEVERIALVALVIHAP